MKQREKEVEGEGSSGHVSVIGTKKPISENRKQREKEVEGGGSSGMCQL